MHLRKCLAKYTLPLMARPQSLTAREIAALIGISKQTETRVFEREREGLVVERPECMHKLNHRSIRIPRAACERVVSRLTVR